MAKTAARKNKTPEAPQRTILFGKENYALIVAGLVVVIIGFFLMAGGAQNDPDVWNAEEIYSFRRITLAPMVVLLGLGLVIFSIFKTPSNIPVATVAEEAPDSDEDIIA
jgi:ABC-type transport system involved in multi-copper enzyme maturation permease subunit